MLLTTTATTTVVDIKLTSKGKELLAKGLNERDFFDIVSFAFGDSEVDYQASPSETVSTKASSDSVSFKSKLFVSGIIPTGTAAVSLTYSTLNLTKNSRASIAASTTWPGVAGEYYENYTWQNLGPLNDYDFTISVDDNTRSATIITYDVLGTTTIKVMGQISGKYELLTLNIT